MLVASIVSRLRRTLYGQCSSISRMSYTHSHPEAATLEAVWVECLA